MGVRQSLGAKVTDAGRKISGDEPEPVAKPVKAPWWVVVLTFLATVVLVVAGVLVLAAGRDMWIDADAPEVVGPPSKKTFEVVKKPVKISFKGNEKRRLRTVSRTVTKERASQGGGRSESLSLAILATGAALLLAGAFAARMTSLKLPGGVELVTAAAYNAGVEAGTTSTAQAAIAAKEKNQESVLGDERKLIEAGRRTLRIHLEEEGISVPEAIGVTGVRPLGGRNLEAAASQAVDDVAEQ